jgi:hypothetical protein
MNGLIDSPEIGAKTALPLIRLLDILDRNRPGFIKAAVNRMRLNPDGLTNSIPSPLLLFGVRRKNNILKELFYEFSFASRKWTRGQFT